MTNATAEVRLKVDCANPGQFFACCGLLELADRLWKGAEGEFHEGTFAMRAMDRPHVSTSLSELVTAIALAPLTQLDADDETASAISVGLPFNLRLDWWNDAASGGAHLKVWAGRMSSIRIARAMQNALRQPECQAATLLDYADVVYDAVETSKKVEPFYFDGRRGASARPLDIGFSPDSLQLTSVAYPAVEFLALVGLQRCRPNPSSVRRVFEYQAWRVPLTPEIAALAVCGVISTAGGETFRFENAFRTDQRKHKAFTPATIVSRS